jgi:hypothetical protein|tara:strand:+ start:112 stop:570 length:459 start_codon:yes stop_codon:yes gene_type:complete
MTTKSKTNIIKILMEARADIEPIKKSGTNPHFGNKYATLESVIEAVTEPLQKHGFLLMHRTISNEHGKSITTELVHESGESFVTAIPLVLGKNDMQGLGSAITYARRYGIMSLLNLPAEDDDGEQNRKGTAQKLAPVDAPAPETKRTTNTNW